jgi:5-methylcytosine-specific restriction endonuclease McrA
MNDPIPVFNPFFKAKQFVDPNTHQDRPDRKNGWRWYKLRRAYLKRNPWCERCGLLGDHVHHIIPRHINKDKIYDWNNLMTLCQFCHAKEHGMGEWKEEKKNV